MRNPIDYTPQLREMHKDWSFDHLIRCNKYCKLYVDQHQDITTAVSNYRQAFMNKSS